MPRNIDFESERYVAIKEWLEEKYAGGPDSVALSTLSMGAVELFLERSRHTVIYQYLENDPENELTRFQIDFLADNGYAFCDYEGISDKRTFRDAREPLSFASGSVLEPPILPDVFDGLYLDLFLSQLCAGIEGYNLSDDLNVTGMALAVYFEKVRHGGHLYLHVPVARSSALPRLRPEFNMMLSEELGGAVLSEDVVEMRARGMTLADLLLVVEKRQPIDAGGIRAAIMGGTAMKAGGYFDRYALKPAE